MHTHLRTDELIHTLTKEKIMLANHLKDTRDHSLSIHYLMTGIYFEKDTEKYGILYACVYDYENLVKTYLG